MNVKDSYQFPRMDEFIDSQGEANVFTALDAYIGYRKRALQEEDWHNMAFVCHAGHYQFVCMSSGLTKAPATFQRALDMMLAGIRGRQASSI